jgi:hypothetical protein
MTCTLRTARWATSCMRSVYKTSETRSPSPRESWQLGYIMTCTLRTARWATSCMRGWMRGAQESSLPLAELWHAMGQDPFERRASGAGGAHTYTLACACLLRPLLLPLAPLAAANHRAHSCSLAALAFAATNVTHLVFKRDPWTARHARLAGWMTEDGEVLFFLRRKKNDII